uniref:Oxidoreductase family, NAD-binding Rossmann fold n=1 Tax=Candidatus Kentrum sp. FW TaxID=2126338 RepID=A0A450T5S3_9GAMM|nr:MAG: Oxidoreductase family, NAD-binding Rossmann fold [Candidatus Kentron sp. FW]
MLRAAVIGVGSMGRNHARIYSQLENANLVAVSDVNGRIAKQVSLEFKTKGYTDYREMLNKEKIDIVSVVVPGSLHKEVNHALNGLADMKIPALIAVVSYWGIALPVGVVLGFVMGLGVTGLWWGLIIGMGVACVAYLTRFRWVVRNARFMVRGTELS